jgi:hypothetical protein
MSDTSFGLWNRTAFDAQHNISWALSANSHHGRPIDDALAARTTDRRTRHLPAFRIGLLAGNIFGMQMNQPTGH